MKRLMIDTNIFISAILFPESNDDLYDLMQTRKVTWLDNMRIKNNPDFIQVLKNGELISLKLLKCHGSDVIVEAVDKTIYIIDTDGNIRLDSE